MKTINQVLDETKIGETIKIDEEDYSELEQKIINKLFITFEDIFKGFEHSYGSAKAYDGAKRQWLIAFKKNGINEIEKIKKVCDECRLMESHFMLSIGKFISIYKSIGAYDRQYPMLDLKRLEVQKASEETAKSQMEKIRAMLR